MRIFAIAPAHKAALPSFVVDKRVEDLQQRLAGPCLESRDSKFWNLQPEHASKSACITSSAHCTVFANVIVVVSHATVETRQASWNLPMQRGVAVLAQLHLALAS